FECCQKLFSYTRWQVWSNIIFSLQRGLFFGDRVVEIEPLWTDHWPRVTLAFDPGTLSHQRGDRRVAEQLESTCGQRLMIAYTHEKPCIFISNDVRDAAGVSRHDRQTTRECFQN